MDINTSSATQAPNAAGGATAQQGSISSQGAAGNVAGNDAVGLPMDLAAIDAALGLPPSVPAAEPVQATPGTDQGQTQAQAALPAAGPTAPEATQTPAATPAPQTTEPANPTPEAQGPAATGERIVPARISTGQFSESTQRAMRLMHELNAGKPEGSEGTVSLAQCLGMITSADSGQSIQATPVTSQPEPTQTQPSELDVLRGEVEELEATIQQAGEDQSLFGPELARATIELADKKAALRTHEALEAQARQSTIQAHVAKRAEIKAQVVAEYKGAEDTSTFLGSRVATLVKEWQDPAHPRHADLNKVDAPKLVVEAAAKEVAANTAKQFGITEEAAMNLLRATPALTTPAAPALSALPPAAGNIQAAAAPGSVSAAPAPVPLTEAQILAQAASNPDLIDGLLGYSQGLRLR